MPIDPDKLRDVRERFYMDRIADLETKRRHSQRATWEWARYHAKLERLRAERGDAPAEQEDDELVWPPAKQEQQDETE